MSDERFMTYEEWVDEFKPIENPQEEGAAFEGCLFDTHVPVDVAAIAEADSACVWTLVDDGENRSITNGWRFVNREGYFITEVPFPDDVFIEVDPDDRDC